ncbi:MarR family transcriptional regulator [bacterium]|nr:MAG: MarR family transcriptional regulator [bacterium]
MGTKFQGTTEQVRALNLFIKLVRAADSVSNRINTYIVSNGLTVSQFGVLESLYHIGPMSQCDIGKKLLKTGGNMTMVIDNLEKRGLVQRVRDENDRRFIHVHLSAEGKALIEEIFPKHVDQIVKELNVLSCDEKDKLSELCKKVGIGEEVIA